MRGIQLPSPYKTRYVLPVPILAHNNMCPCRFGHTLWVPLIAWPRYGIGNTVHCTILSSFHVCMMSVHCTILSSFHVCMMSVHCTILSSFHVCMMSVHCTILSSFHVCMMSVHCTILSSFHVCMVSYLM